MAYVLIASANMRYRRDLADVLIAAGHHVATTSDPVLALSALRLSQRQLIVLLDDAMRLHQPAAQDIIVGAANYKTFPPWLAEKSENTQHAYILLTTLPPNELSLAMRALLRTGKATLMQPNCSVGALLTAVEIADEQLSMNGSGPQILQDMERPLSPGSFSE
ncbi:MAG TPA: hypothetical protein VFU63_06890 [Ktedonobacterales bacterium]|nr:hypothetical protein [Ktedonobacterales bacterium]